LVKKIIKEEHTFTSKQLHSSDEEDRKGMIANTIESFYKLIDQIKIVNKELNKARNSDYEAPDYDTTTLPLIKKLKSEKMNLENKISSISLFFKKGEITSGQYQDMLKLQNQYGKKNSTVDNTNYMM
jgi:hypothetical protein